MRAMIRCKRKKGDTADIRQALDALGVKIENEAMISKDECVLIADVPQDAMDRVRKIKDVASVSSDPGIAHQ